MPTYRLRVEYDGTRYHGWQEQRQTRTVAGELRRALEAGGAEVAELFGSGRTDAGVHALEQVAHARLVHAADPRALRQRVNAALAADVHVLSIDAAPPRFHARHDARARAYLYQVARRRTAFAKRFVWWVREPLDLRTMGEAAAALPGMRDAAMLCERPREQASTLVQVSAAEVAADGALVLVRLVASHFLWKMSRRVVGCLVRVGTGELSMADWRALVARRAAEPVREAAARATAPASGLFLERVLYDGSPPVGPLRAATPVAEEEAREHGGT